MTPETIMPWVGLGLAVTGLTFCISIVAAFIKLVLFGKG